MSKEMREQIDRIKNWKQFMNEQFGGSDDDEDDTTPEFDGSDEDEQIETIEDEIEYDGHMLNFRVEIIDNLGFIDYYFDYITSNEVDEEYIDDNLDDIKKAIIEELGIGIVSNRDISDNSTNYKYVVIDTRNGQTIGSIDFPIDRKAASEIYDIPKKFIDISVVSKS